MARPRVLLIRATAKLRKFPKCDRLFAGATVFPDQTHPESGPLTPPECFRVSPSRSSRQTRPQQWPGAIGVRETIAATARGGPFPERRSIFGRLAEDQRRYGP